MPPLEVSGVWRGSPEMRCLSPKTPHLCSTPNDAHGWLSPKKQDINSRRAGLAPLAYHPSALRIIALGLFAFHDVVSGFFFSSSHGVQLGLRDGGADAVRKAVRGWIERKLHVLQQTRVGETDVVQVYPCSCRKRINLLPALCAGQSGTRHTLHATDCSLLDGQTPIVAAEGVGVARAVEIDEPTGVLHIFMILLSRTAVLTVATIVG